jgi:hypothetical protein
MIDSVMRGRIRGALCGLTLSLLFGLPVYPRAGLAATSQRVLPHPCVFDHMMLHTAPDVCRPQANSYPRQIVGPIHRALYDSTLTYGIPYRTLLRIAACESALNPWAVNGPHYGLFQFLPATFYEGVQRMWQETGIAAQSYWDPRDASYVAGYLFATGEATRWTCVRLIQ